MKLVHKIKERDGFKKLKKAIDKLMKKGKEQEEASYINATLAEQEAQELSKRLMGI